MKKVTMKSQHLQSAISISENKYITRDQLNTLLKTYNYFYADQENLQLSYNQPEGSKPVIEGILAIFWGVRCPIWLKIQDEKQIPPFVTLKSPERVGLFPSKRGMMRWGEVHNLHHISEETPNSSEEPPNHEAGCFSYESSTLKPRSVQELNSLTPHRSRTLSDAAQVRKRENSPTIARKDVDTHRFSINGHFYNYETSVFTPAFGSETKIRINSNMKTGEVIEQLLQKFKKRKGSRTQTLHCWRDFYRVPQKRLPNFFSWTRMQKKLPVMLLSTLNFTFLFWNPFCTN
ncbi:ras association domain-containing protein 6 isoform X2 [Mauremys reevesii]|uniref:ras association domain-containing protein 6 isoform X2 n=1 Tax=Mauremys reevesii TaxID=260615 RepID=UPI00193F897E|nr:ras association domain-containing protein 6 isoform X2 [Mauremys reevesii]